MNYPTPWQRKTIWSALTLLAVVTIGAIFIGLIFLISRIAGLLQPILIPFAVAGVLAYLLDPLVTRMVRAGLPRQRAVIFVFIIVTLGLATIGVWVGPAIARETTNLARAVPKYAVALKELIVSKSKAIQEKYHIRLLPGAKIPGEKTPEDKDETGATKKIKPAERNEKTITPAPSPTESSSLPTEKPTAPGDDADISEKTTGDTAPEFYREYDLQRLLSGDFAGWLAKELPVIIRNTWRFIVTSVGGFLGIFGFLLGFIIVPLYLFYFLTEAAEISRSWADYLPIRASHFKDEVVETLTEINGYLIAFFRGQLLVSIINGTITGIGLVCVGLEFALLLGLMQCVLGLVPYLGFLMCWIPAVIIASVQGGSWLFPHAPWWVLPLVVTGVYFLVQQFDSWFVTPKIVGNSVGLHPMTVIFSVLLWSLLLGGLLGAILAVPLTATAKVLLRRYVWERKLREKNPSGTHRTPPTAA